MRHCLQKIARKYMLDYMLLHNFLCILLANIVMHIVYIEASPENFSTTIIQLRDGNQFIAVSLF